MLGCTQPRRVAAMSLARRVADEFGCDVGSQVGYSIRFEDCTSLSTIIKFMTDGMLLREATRDNLLEHYSVVVLDEAHERSIHTDVLFGVVKGIVKRRPDLKILITSATFDVDKFSKYFLNAPIIKIPGRLFPVDIIYTDDPLLCYYEASIRTTLKIHRTQTKGDILLFLTGQEEIENACEEIDSLCREQEAPLEALVLPLYTALPSDMQAKVFEPTPRDCRKIIVATNVAETSLTIDGVSYVVDSGAFKQKTYDPKTGMESLTVSMISQTQANQRSGRAGRLGPGKAYRIYSKLVYNRMELTQQPEILRNELTSTVLQLKALSVHEIMKFDFMDAPPRQALQRGVRSLQLLQALSKDEILTELGRQMTQFPLSPPLAKMLIKSLELGCSEEILTIAAMMSSEHIFINAKKKRALANKKKEQFNVPGSDHLTLLKAYNDWVNMGMSKEWCKENFIQYRRIRQAKAVRDQLRQIVVSRNMTLTSCGKDTNKVLQALCHGLCQNTAVRHAWSKSYRTVVDLQEAFIHPSSVVFRGLPQWVVYDALLKTGKPYIRCVSEVQSAWVPSNILQMAVNSAIATVNVTL